MNTDKLDQSNLATALVELEQSQNLEQIFVIKRRLSKYLDEGKMEHKDLCRMFLGWLQTRANILRVPGAKAPKFTSLSEEDPTLAETMKEWTIEWQQQGSYLTKEEGLTAKRMNDANPT